MNLKMLVVSVCALASCATVHASEYCPTQTTGDPVICLARDGAAAVVPGQNFEIEAGWPRSWPYPTWGHDFLGMCILLSFIACRLDFTVMTFQAMFIF
jgi:hypothetical protein